MAEVLIKEETLTAVADKIREKTGTNNRYKPKEMEEAVEDVYDAGKQAEYEKMWTPMWRERPARNFNEAFSGSGWNDDTFCPPVGVSPRIDSSSSMFRRSYITDLEGLLKSRSITLNFENSDYVTSLFEQCSLLTHVPVISCVNAKNSLAAIFSTCPNLISVRKLILKADGANTFSNAFLDCNSLEHIEIEGVIGNNIDFQYSPLSKFSIESIVAALSDAVSGKTLTLNKTAVNTAFGINVDDETTWGEGTEFYSLRHLKDNWTFSYA